MRKLINMSTFETKNTVNFIPFTVIQFASLAIGGYFLGEYLKTKFDTLADDQFFTGSAKLNNGTYPAIEITTAAVFAAWGLMTLIGAYVVPKTAAAVPDQEEMTGGARKIIQNPLALLFSVPFWVLFQATSLSLSLVQPALDQMLRFALAKYKHETDTQVNDACEELANAGLPLVIVAQFFLMVTTLAAVLFVHGGLKNDSVVGVLGRFFGFHPQDDGSASLRVPSSPINSQGSRFAGGPSNYSPFHSLSPQGQNAQRPLNPNSPSSAICSKEHEPSNASEFDTENLSSNNLLHAPDSMPGDHQTADNANPEQDKQSQPAGHTFSTFQQSDNSLWVNSNDPRYAQTNYSAHNGPNSENHEEEQWSDDDSKAPLLPGSGSEQEEYKETTAFTK